jgi:acyl carrier protein
MQPTDTTELILSCLREVLEAGGALPAEPLSADTKLLGRNAVLDSLGLVQLLVDVEQQLDSAHGVAVTLADERAMSQKHSPFRSVGTLSEYIETLIKEHPHART